MSPRLIPEDRIKIEQDLAFGHSVEWICEKRTVTLAQVEEARRKQQAVVDEDLPAAEKLKPEPIYGDCSCCGRLLPTTKRGKVRWHKSMGSVCAGTSRPAVST